MDSSKMSRRQGDEEWQLSKTCVQDRFKELLRLARWTDCSFRVGHHKVEVINGHKLVLAVSSPVFEALFFGPLSDSSIVTITVPDIEPHTFKTLFQYVYTDEVEMTGIEEVGDLLYAAKKYLIEPLSELCLAYLVQHTSIRTLWQVLDIAQALNEERLLSACLKVMSRYHYEFWSSENEQLPGEIMCRLLDLTEMNMTEFDLWEMVVEWARREAISLGTEDTPERRRQIMQETGLTSRLRLLTLPTTLLDRLTPILTEKEVEAVRERAEVPDHFSSETSERRSVLPVVWKCARDILSRRNNLWLNRAEVVCNIYSTARVLVIGFEVLTRSTAQTAFFTKTVNSTYRERLAVSISDSHGNLLQKTDYDTSVLFDTSQKIHLARPLWFEENQSYSVNIGFIGGQYPYCLVADNCSNGTGAKFFFDEMLIIEGIPNKYLSSFIISVLYAL